MSRSRILVSLAGAALGISLLGACSADSLAEFGLEQAIEAQGDGDVDIDFSNGGFSINGEDGEFSLDFDQENGGIVFSSDEGSGSIQFDEDGTVVFDTDEGSGTVTFDETGVVIDAEGTENDATINVAGDDGAITFETDDGVVNYFGATEVPDAWPSVVGVPATMVQGETFFSAIGDESGVTYTAAFIHNANEDFAGAVIDRLSASGFSTEFEMTMPDGTSSTLTNGEINVSIIDSQTGTTIVTVTPAWN